MRLVAGGKKRGQKLVLQSSFIVMEEKRKSSFIVMEIVFSLIARIIMLAVPVLPASPVCSERGKGRLV